LSRNFPSDEKHWVSQKLLDLLESLHAEYASHTRTDDKGNLPAKIGDVLPPFPSTKEEIELGPSAFGKNILYNENCKQVAVIVEKRAAVRFYAIEARVSKDFLKNKQKFLKFQNNFC
jgi:hypothetical protein